MKKRLITSLSVSFILAAIPMIYAWLKVGRFEFGDFIAHQFVLSVMIFVVAFVMVAMYPGWGND